MTKLLQPGRIIFATGMLALSVICFISGDFIVGRPPAWPAQLGYAPLIGYVSATLLAVSALALLARIKPLFAAYAVAALILLLSLTRELAQFLNNWLAAYKTLALFGGALIIAASYTEKSSTRNRLIVAGSCCNALFLIASGYAHFKFADFVNGFIPAYIPFHPFWTYFCGICLAAGGVGLLIPLTRKWAAVFSGIMIGGWFLLLHIPRFVANTKDASDRMGLCESFTFTGIFLVLAAITGKFWKYQAKSK